MDYPRDSERYKYFDRESREHGAKLELRSFIDMVNMYTEPGDMLLEPMGGIGTALYAATMGRKVMLIEINPDFIDIMRLNIKKLNEVRVPEGGTEIVEGENVQIHNLDCRRILPMADAFDACIFSPPYGLVMAKSKAKDENKLYEDKGFRMSYSDDAGNIGNLNVYPQYLDAMKTVYGLILQSLKPGKIMVTVVKDYNKNFKRVYVSKDNARVAVEAGFQVVDWHTRNAPGTVLQHIGRERRAAAGKGTSENEIIAEDYIVLEKPKGKRFE
jgi:modification methylase